MRQRERQCRWRAVSTDQLFADEGTEDEVVKAKVERSKGWTAATVRQVKSWKTSRGRVEARGPGAGVSSAQQQSPADVQRSAVWLSGCLGSADSELHSTHSTQSWTQPWTQHWLRFRCLFAC